MWQTSQRGLSDRCHLNNKSLQGKIEFITLYLNSINLLLVKLSNIDVYTCDQYCFDPDMFNFVTQYYVSVSIQNKSSLLLGIIFQRNYVMSFVLCSRTTMKKRKNG